jgi:hypothetical protein
MDCLTKQNEPMKYYLIFLMIFVLFPAGCEKDKEAGLI